MPKPATSIDPSSLVDPSVACCAGCAKLEDESVPTVVLLSGASVCSWCPAWLRETQARHVEAQQVLGMVDRDTRQAHLAKRAADFGAEYRRRLEAVIMEIWNARQARLAETPETTDV
jgi:hypothetical protein